MKIFGKDFTHLYFAPASALTRFEYDQNINARMLDSAELHRLSEDSRYDLSNKAVKYLDSEDFSCCGVFDGDELVAYSFFAVRDIPPELNSGGYPFAGIGARMPEGVVFIFKAFCLPDYRGQRLVALAIRFGGLSMAGPRGWIVSTADVNNHPSDTMFRKMGLKRQTSILKEYRIFNRARYRFPSEVQLGEPGAENSKTIELYAP